MSYLRNAWYLGAFADELKAGEMLARTLLDEPLVFFRQADGSVAALFDRCPHRFAPLSKGRLCDGGASVQCGYHGLRFGSLGNCVHNPHGDGVIPKALRVKAYATRERDGLIWWWAGDAGEADDTLIPDCSQITRASEHATVRGYVPMTCHYQLLVDNILDLTHADYLHTGTLGSGALSRCKPEVEELSKGGIRITWLSNGDYAPPAFDAHLRRQGQLTDQWTEVTWTPPSIMLLRLGATLHGESREQGVEAMTWHIVTPESADRTHYWYWGCRNFSISPEANAVIAPMIEHTFTQQDKPMLEAQQQRMGSAEFWSLKPRLLRSDAAAIRVRRKLDSLIQAGN
jgi:phenylpropionate dioxygenase-like ring-hydroxylating dioxygenase large terminal subunit